MRNAIYTVVIAAMVILVSACASKDIANRYYSNQQYTAKAPAEVQILTGAPAEEFEVIADFQMRRETPNEIRNRAAKIGADAVIVTLLGGERGEAEEWAGGDAKKARVLTSGEAEGVYSRIVGTAIKYK